MIAFAGWAIFKIVLFLKYYCGMVFRMFLAHFFVLTQADHFAKTIAFAWADLFCVSAGRSLKVLESHKIVIVLVF